jgi:hypothetical protein
MKGVETMTINSNYNNTCHYKAYANNPELWEMPLKDYLTQDRIDWDSLRVDTTALLIEMIEARQMKQIDEDAFRLRMKEYRELYTQWLTVED